jgi:hypothetical protein
LKIIKEHATSILKYLSVIALRDETIITKEVQIAQQMALINTYKVRLFSKEKTSKAQKKALSIEHDTAVALLEVQMDLKKKEAIHERSKALNVGRDLSNAHNKSNKLQANVTKFWKDFDDLACQVCDSKSELTRQGSRRSSPPPRRRSISSLILHLCRRNT